MYKKKMSFEVGIKHRAQEDVHTLIFLTTQFN